VEPEAFLELDLRPSALELNWQGLAAKLLLSQEDWADLVKVQAESFLEKGQEEVQELLLDLAVKVACQAHLGHLAHQASLAVGWGHLKAECQAHLGHLAHSAQHLALQVQMALLGLGRLGLLV